MPISMDPAFMRQMMTKLTELQEQLDHVQVGHGLDRNQSLDNLAVAAGTDAFPPGERIRTQIAATGTILHNRVDAQSKMLAGLVTGLDKALEIGHNTESLNSMEAASLMEWLPDTSNTSTTTTPPSTDTPATD